jgi:hypothetical protein
MGLFDDGPGTYDENSFWYLLRDREDRALDQAVKANRHLMDLEADLAQGRATTTPSVLELEAKVVDLERKLLGLGLYTRTILQLLVDKGLLGEDEFAARLRELDRLDGREDGV